ncbi:MAG TPA: helix-turn-helix transcriptional regulator [Niabella sp.]|nr:helix-turn-helix transcriptional regulator [Niabella sp.]
MITEEIKKLNKAFGENLQKIRNSKKISLLQLSYNCSVDESKISKIEHGRFNIKLSTVYELAKGLNISPKKLLDFEFELEE